jgi:hypothetical protein
VLIPDELAAPPPPLPPVPDELDELFIPDELLVLDDDGLSPLDEDEPEPPDPAGGSASQPIIETSVLAKSVVKANHRALGVTSISSW